MSKTLLQSAWWWIFHIFMIFFQIYFDDNRESILWMNIWHIFLFLISSQIFIRQENIINNLWSVYQLIRSVKLLLCIHRHLTSFTIILLTFSHDLLFQVPAKESLTSQEDQSEKICFLLKLSFSCSDNKKIQKLGKRLEKTRFDKNHFFTLIFI